MRGYNSSSDNFLFHKADWFSVAEYQKKKIAEEIEKQNPDQLLNTSTDDLARYYEQKYSINVPTLFPEEIVVDQRETSIDVSHDFRYGHRGDGPHMVPGTAIDVDLPFEGDAEAFHIQPSTRNFNNPRAQIVGSVVRFTIAGVGLDAARVKSDIDGYISSINQHLEWLRNDVRGFNASLFQIAKSHIERRKDKLLKDRSLVSGLGFKMKERGASSTYAAPHVQRQLKPEIKMPVASRAPYSPEPILLDTDYEHILGILENMVQVMELSPGAFQKIDEESLRTHFLMQLNGHYKGEATSETFNFEGKTDILIKSKGRNIFIGECKFWTGEKGFLETIDQVLSYLSWRDTKAAILIFNRNKDFSAVLEKIQQATVTHKNCKRLLKKCSETSWSYLFGHKDDANREITITVQAYNVPERIEPRIRTI